MKSIEQRFRGGKNWIQSGMLRHSDRRKAGVVFGKLVGRKKMRWMLVKCPGRLKTTAERGFESGGEEGGRGEEDKPQKKPHNGSGGKRMGKKRGGAKKIKKCCGRGEGDRQEGPKNAEQGLKKDPEHHKFMSERHRNRK